MNVLDEFNENTFKLYKAQFTTDDEKKAFLQQEIDTAMCMYSEQVVILLNELAEQGYESETFQHITNLDKVIGHLRVERNKFEQKEGVNNNG